MASTDARPVPRKNVPYRVTFPIFDADGDLVTGAASLDSEVSKDGGTFTDCTNEATEIATSSGVYCLDLTSSEMNADTVAIIVKTGTAGAKTTPIILYPEELGDVRIDTGTIRTELTTELGRIDAAVSTRLPTASYTAPLDAAGTRSALGLATANLDTQLGAIDDFLDTEVAAIKAKTDNLPASPAAVGSAMTLANGSIAAATFAAGAIDAAAIAADAIGSSELAASAASEIATAVRTELTTELARVDATVSSRLAAASYAAPLDAAGVRGAVGLAAANLDTQLSGVAAAVWGYVTRTVASVAGAVGSVTGNVGGNVAGSVGSLAAQAQTDVQTAMTGQGYTATRAGYLDVLNGLVQAIWDKATSALTTAGSIGKRIVDYLTGDAFGRIGANGAGLTAIGDTRLANLDATVSSRLATAGYTAPLDASGVRAAVGLASANLDTQLTAIDDFLDTEVAAIKAKTDLIPASPASTTNITAAAGIAVASIGAGVITAASIAADAITDAKVAADVTIASVTGSVGSVTGSVGSVVGAVGSVTSGVTVTTNNDKTGYGLSGAAVQAIWDALTSALTTVGSIGKRIVDYLTGDVFARVGANGAGLTALGDTRLANLDATVSSRLATAGYTAPPSAATNASAVRTELGTELGRIDVAVSSRLATAGYSAPLDAAGVRSAVGLASANLDTQLDTLPTAAENAAAVRSNLTTELGRIDAAVSTRSTLAAADVRAAIGLATANLDTQLADIPTGAEMNARTLAAADYATASALDTVDNLIDTEIAAIKAKTDNLPVSPAATGDIPTAATIADAVWDEATAGHQSAGTTGKAISDAGNAGDPMGVQVPGNYAAGTAGYIVGMLRAGVVSLISPVAPATNELSIVAGASYTTHVPINIEIPTSVVSLTGATVQFKLHTPKSLTVTATVTNAGAAGQAVTIALTAAQTADLGVFETLATEYSIIATWTGPEVYPFVYRNRAIVYKSV